MVSSVYCIRLMNQRPVLLKQIIQCMLKKKKSDFTKLTKVRAWKKVFTMHRIHHDTSQGQLLTYKDPRPPYPQLLTGPG